MRDLGSVIIDADDDRIDVSFLAASGQVLDDFTITTTPQPPTLSSTGLVSGQSASLSVSQATPGSSVVIAYSLAGPGPTASIYGDLDLGLPIGQMPTGTANYLGVFQVDKIVPAMMSGQTIWFQAVEITGTNTGLLTNGIVEMIQ